MKLNEKELKRLFNEVDLLCRNWTNSVQSYSNCREEVSDDIMWTILQLYRYCEGKKADQKKLFAVFCIVYPELYELEYSQVNVDDIIVGFDYFLYTNFESRGRGIKNNRGKWNTVKYFNEVDKNNATNCRDVYLTYVGKIGATFIESCSFERTGQVNELKKILKTQGLSTLI